MVDELSDSEEDLKQRIVTHLKKTGYPLELQAADTLEGRGWSVTTNTLYFDTTENKYREFDIDAFRFRFTDLGDAGSHALICELLIECKKSDKRPWIFFTRLSKTGQAPSLTYVLAIQDLTSAAPGHETILNPEAIMHAFWYFETQRSRNFTEAFKPDLQPSQIYVALNQAVKASRHSMAQWERLARDGITIFFIPIVVVDGLMFAAQLIGGDINLAESKHIVVEFDFISPEEPLKTNHVLVDVVTGENLVEYLQKVDRAFDHVQQALTQSAQVGRIHIESKSK